MTPPKPLEEIRDALAAEGEICEDGGLRPKWHAKDFKAGFDAGYAQLQPRVAELEAELDQWKTECLLLRQHDRNNGEAAKRAAALEQECARLREALEEIAEHEWTLGEDTGYTDEALIAREALAGGGG